MATFPDLSSFNHFLTEASAGRADGTGTLTLPIRGHDYTWHAGRLSVWAMLQLQRLDALITESTRRLAAGETVDMDQVALTAAEQKRLDRELVGEENLERMADDGVLWPEAMHVAATLTTWYLSGEAAALTIWSKTGEDTPADPPARAASTKTAGSSTRKTKALAPAAGQRSSRTGTSSKRASRPRTTST